MVVILKPTYGCNLSCKYCYLSSESKVYSFFDVDFIISVIDQIFEYCNTHHRQSLTLIWHGGEPLLWGIDRYSKVFDYIEKHYEGYPYRNLIQTNLTLIDQGYIDLFKRYNVKIGFSLDGPEDLHDMQRVTRDGKGSFSKVFEKIQLCRENSLPIGCIVVATKFHLGEVKRLYNFMNDNKISFKVNPLFFSGEAKKNKDSIQISVKQYAEFCVELFDIMFDDPNCNISNSNFAEIASSMISGKVAGCLLGENCQGSFLAISPNGSVFPCGRFCDSEYENFAYGNLHELSFQSIIKEIYKSDIYHRFDFIKKSNCNSCEFFSICHGGCLHDGYLNSNDFRHKTFLCPAYKIIFSHIKKRLIEKGFISQHIDSNNN